MYVLTKCSDALPEEVLVPVMAQDVFDRTGAAPFSVNPSLSNCPRTS